MTRKLLSMAAVALVSTSLVGMPAHAQSRSDQSEARKEMKAGNILPFAELERRVLQRMRGSDYLGNRYYEKERAYRFKFIKDGRVTFVDVDARTGRVISRSR